MIYFPTGFGGPLYAINPNSTIEWTCTGLGDLRYTSPGIGADDTIYMAGGFDNDLHAVTPDGSVVWSFNTTNTVISSPIIDGNSIIYIASYDTLFAINPDGTMKWELEIEPFTTSTPAMDTGGNLYICSGTKLYAIGPGGGTGIVDNLIQPAKNFLQQNYPNPFNPETTISFDIKEHETGILMIFNIKGQLIESHRFESGKHNYLWDASERSSGIYLYKLQTQTITETKKMILLK
jgi:hypothetical protein